MQKSIWRIWRVQLYLCTTYIGSLFYGGNQREMLMRNDSEFGRGNTRHETASAGVQNSQDISQGEWWCWAVGLQGILQSTIISLLSPTLLSSFSTSSLSASSHLSLGEGFQVATGFITERKPDKDTAEPPPSIYGKERIQHTLHFTVVSSSTVLLSAQTSIVLHMDNHLDTLVHAYIIL